MRVVCQEETADQLHELIHAHRRTRLPPNAAQCSETGVHRRQRNGYRPADSMERTLVG